MATPEGMLFELVLLAMSIFFMMMDMRRRPSSGFFRPVMLGFVPIVFFCARVFFSMQEGGPEVLKFKESFRAQLTQAMSGVSEKDGGPSAQDIQDAADELVRFCPGLQSLFWLCILSVVASVLRPWMARRGLSRAAPPLSKWKAPSLVIWTVLAPAGVILIGDRVGDLDPALRDFCLNILVVTLSIYVFQGCMVVIERMSRMGLPKLAAGMLLGLGLLMSLLPLGRGLALGILALGLLETWFDFRNLDKKDNDKERSSL